MNKRLQKFISVIITLCIIVGLVPLVTVPASATTVGSWRVYTGTSAANATLHSTHTGNNSLRDAFNVYANTGAAFVRIHHNGTAGTAYDLGATNPGFSIGNGRTLALTGTRCSYWSGLGNRHVFHLTGGTLYVGQNITVNKTNTWSAVGATSGTSTLFNFGTISRSGGSAIHIDSGNTLNHFSWANSTTTGSINNQGTHNRTWLYTLSLSGGTGVSSVNYPAGWHDVPLRAEGFYAYNRVTGSVDIPAPNYQTHFGASYSPTTYSVTSTSATISHTITATRLTRSITNNIANTSLNPASVGSGQQYSGTLNANTGWNRPASITVMRGSTNITSTVTYVPSTGAITIPAAETTANITITGTATRINRTVTNNIANTSLTPVTVGNGLAYSGTLTANTGWNRPESITMTRGGTAFTNFSYTASTGAISIAAAQVTGNFVISGTAIRINYSVTAPANTSLSATSVGHGLAYSGTLNADMGWNRPASITVMRGSTNITNTVTYVPSTGVITIPAAETTANITITGTATRITYPVTFNANGGTGAPASQTKQHGINLTLSNTIPTRDSHDFIEWNTREDGTGTALQPGEIYSGNEPLTLYAQWTRVFNANAIVDDKTSTNFTVDSENLGYVLENHIVTDDDIENNNWVTLTLTVSETDDTADGADRIIDRTRGRLLQFFGVTVTKQVNDYEPVTLSELPVPIQVVIDLSPELSGKTGYTVYRYHGNEVQLLGMDTDADEYFTISRGTGASNVDQVIINTKRFSTYAVVENILTLKPIGTDGEPFSASDDVDVRARIHEITTPVYKIDIEWGDMKFEYNMETRGAWNNQTRRYEEPDEPYWVASGFDGVNNRITVTNHSNADVIVAFEVTKNELTPVMMEVYKQNVSFANNDIDDDDDSDADNDADDGEDSEQPERAINMPLGRVPSVGNDALKVSAYLHVNGEPSEADIEKLNADTWHKIGIITVTITPDGDELTPWQ